MPNSRALPVTRKATVYNEAGIPRDLFYDMNEVEILVSDDRLFMKGKLVI